MSWSAERKVGVFTLLGIGAFAYTTLFLSNITLFSPPKINVVGEFNSVDGLKEGNPIRYQGVPIGKVKHIVVGKDTVMVTMNVDKDIEIPSDSKVTLQTDGLLGEKYISITPGVSKHYLQEDSIIVGDGRQEMEEAFAHMNKVLDQAEKLLQTMNKMAGDEETQANLKQSVANAALITGNLVQTTTQLNNLLEQNTDNMNKVASHIVKLSQNLDNISAQLNNTLDTVDGDGESAKNIRTIISNVKDTSESLKVISGNLEEVLGNQETAKDLKQTIDNAAHLSSVLTNITGGNAGGIETNLELLHGGNNDEYNSNFNMKMKNDKRVLVLGANNIGNGTSLELNAGRELANQLTARAGIFGGEVGLGLDYGLVNRPFTLSAVATNPNDLNYRIRGEVRLFENVKAVAQTIRPHSAENAGEYYGVQYNF